jgi:hypothetical protein
MSSSDWSRFEALVDRVATEVPTLAQAHGVVISRLIEQKPLPARSAPTSLDWMDWERQKTLRLLRSAV